MPKQTLDPVEIDVTDNRILECAVESDSDFLITGDKHLLRLGQYGKTRIVPPSEFLEERR